jgi:hypothetical protein
MTSKAEANTNRRNYRKPKAEQVKLMSEENVLQTCKMGGGEGPGVKNCERGFQVCYQKSRS